MEAARSSLLGLLVLIGAFPAFAAAAAAVAAPDSAAPLESPADWIDPGDYPRDARRFGMAGITAFQLTVDAAGEASRCEIVESSGFDILDTATCDRLMAKARFSPARDQKGEPVEGSYSSRVQWVLQSDSIPPVSESFTSVLLSIDQTGKATSCDAVFHAPAETALSSENLCERMMDFYPLPLGMEFRRGFQGPSAEIEVRMADAFTPALRAEILSPIPGYEQRALNVYRLTVNSDGKLEQCNYEEQRGIERMAVDFCMMAYGDRYDPPFGAFDDNGVATGWHITRVLLKTGE